MSEERLPGRYFSKIFRKKSYNNRKPNYQSNRRYQQCYEEVRATDYYRPSTPEAETDSNNEPDCTMSTVENCSYDDGNFSRHNNRRIASEICDFSLENSNTVRRSYRNGRHFKSRNTFPDHNVDDESFITETSRNFESERTGNTIKKRQQRGKCFRKSSTRFDNSNRNTIGACQGTDMASVSTKDEPEINRDLSVPEAENAFSPTDRTHSSLNEERERDDEYHQKLDKTINKLCSSFSLFSGFSKRNGNNGGRRNGSRKTEPKNRREILILQLQKNEVECMICCSIIRRDVAIWHCTICFQIFHLFCIKKWSSAEHSQENASIQQWRCPTCQSLFDSIPNNYYCFCGKQKNPLSSNYNVPHSCGDMCGKVRSAQNKNCTHPCTEVCHPGPCPSCSFLMKTKCKCGKLSKPQQCSFVQEWNCNLKCGKLLSCGNHICDKLCHGGLCDPCSLEMKQYCFSHGKERIVTCTNEFSPEYSCNEVCGKTFDCGVHSCTQVCHPLSCGKCPFDPEVITTCCCGRNLIAQLNCERVKCTDPLVKCGATCDKMLACGNGEHRCKMLCHEGPCTCELETVARCRCFKKNKVVLPCMQILKGGVKEILCNQTCGKRKSCGRHTCTNVCCTLNDSEHVCMLLCNRKLSCGVHQCQELCHKGRCRRCLESRFEDWTCECGRTTLSAPILCGTKLPDCQYPCSRAHSCDHPVLHNCHRAPNCPPCVFLVDKTCMCKKSVIHNVQCFLKDVSCGSLCGKVLPCGFHTCKRVCHLGECISEGEKCTQPCDALRKECGHTCALPCHGDSECPDSVCLEKVFLKCSCGRRSEYTICRIKSKPTGHNNSLASRLFAEDSKEVANIKQAIESRKLECDEECERQIRLRNIAVALKIDPDNPTFNGIIYNDFLKEFGRKQAAFVKGVEERLSALVSDTIKRQCVYNTTRFPAVGWTKRRFIHELAPAYGCSTQSEGKDPNRYITASCRFGYCWIPSRSLTETLSCEKRVPPPVNITSINER